MGLCLIKKMEAIDSKIEKAKTKQDTHRTKKVNVSGEHKKQKDTAPCTGMFALMRQITG